MHYTFFGANFVNARINPKPKEMSSFLIYEELGDEMFDDFFPKRRRKKVDRPQKMPKGLRDLVFGNALAGNKMRGKVRFDSLPPSVRSGLSSARRKIRQGKELTAEDKGLLDMFPNRIFERMQRRKRRKVFFNK